MVGDQPQHLSVHQAVKGARALPMVCC